MSRHMIDTGNERFTVAVGVDHAFGRFVQIWDAVDTDARDPEYDDDHPTHELDNSTRADIVALVEEKTGYVMNDADQFKLDSACV